MGAKVLLRGESQQGRRLGGQATRFPEHKVPCWTLVPLTCTSGFIAYPKGEDQKRFDTAKYNSECYGIWRGFPCWPITNECEFSKSMKAILGFITGYTSGFVPTTPMLGHKRSEVVFEQAGWSSLPVSTYQDRDFEARHTCTIEYTPKGTEPAPMFRLGTSRRRPEISNILPTGTSSTPEAHRFSCISNYTISAVSIERTRRWYRLSRARWRRGGYWFEVPWLKQTKWQLVDQHQIPIRKEVQDRGREGKGYVQVSLNGWVKNSMENASEKNLIEGKGWR